MDVVIVGAGEVGHHLAEVLSNESQRVTVIDSDAAKIQRLSESLDVQAVVGDGTQADVLTRCGSAKADLFIAVTSDDHVNMLACVLASRLGARRRILRLKDIRPLEGYRYFYKHSLGFDVVLSTEELAAEEIVHAVSEQNALEVQTFVDGRVHLRRLRLSGESALTSAPLSELRLPGGVRVGGVLRKDRFLVPEEDERLAVDDHVYLLGRGKDLDAFERMLGRESSGRRSVVLMGAGGIGTNVALQLAGRDDVSLRVIERSAARAQALANRVAGGVLVLVGDATDLDLLLEERIGEADLFVATSDEDERNMVACQLARSLGVKRTIALVNRGSYRQIYDLLGIDRAISPRILCAARIMRFVRSSSVASIAVIGEGRAEVLEVEAHLRSGAIRVRDIDLPRGALVAAVVHREEVLLAGPNTPIEEGDHVIAVSVAEHAQQVEALLREGVESEGE
jgi:trk system potassium uptake protein TrkA